MSKLRIALAQINPTVGDLTGNVLKIKKFIKKAEDVNSDIVVFPELSITGYPPEDVNSDIIVFPELSITGYPPEDLLLKSHFIEDNVKAAKEVAKHTSNIIAIYGFVEKENNKIFNSAAISHNQQLLGTQKKIYLPNYGVFDEKRYFSSGHSHSLINLENSTVGINICEDIWYPNPTKNLAVSGVSTILNINGSPFQIGKIEERKRLLIKRAKENKVNIAYVNMVGGQDELVFDGGSMFINFDGKIQVIGPQFTEKLLVYDLDEHQNQDRTQSITYSTNSININSINIKAFKNKKHILEKFNTKQEFSIEEDQILQALILGTKDYVQKTGFSKVLIALSGGIDSALVATIASLALGPENVRCVYLPSRFSSQSSKSDANQLCINLGINLNEISIEGIFSKYESTLFEEFKNTNWGVAEENLQSRIRGALVMALSNKFGYLVLTTGNKSEMAVGYATIYGDMAGGFAVIKDVPKTLVYKISNYINLKYKKEIIPESIITKEPSAELKFDQKDSDNLPPYEILDKILELYVEKDFSTYEIQTMGFDNDIINHVIKLVDKNEYKRRQSAPGIKITAKNFDRDRRMPLSNKYIN
ncbi:MAG: NAD+ synthase [SAR202 cluster bacterium]|nr:MAG: NAD+ synthase [SAR202 cluster bacterium]